LIDIDSQTRICEEMKTKLEQTDKSIIDT
jgi:hypothetical protein